MNNIIKFIRHNGFCGFLKKVCGLATEAFYENKSLIIFKLSTANVAVPAIDIHFTELTPSDVNQMQQTMYLSRKILQKRFSRGDRCFAVLDGERILSFFWVLFSQRILFEHHINVNLQAKQAWMYNAITIKEARGKGLYYNIILKIATTLSQQGIDELFVDAANDNVASIRGIEKVGCKEVVKIRIKKLFSKRKYHLHIYDKLSWKQLSEKIVNFSDSIWIIDE